MKPFIAMTAIATLFATTPISADTSANGLMYVGTLDKKLLVIDEDKEEVVGEIPMAGVPRITALSADKKHLYVVSTKMGLESVDLETRKSTNLLNLSDGRGRPDIFGFSLPTC